MKRRVVAGIVLAKYPPHSAGHRLSVLHWLLGFRELGWDVWIVENISSAACVDRNGRACEVEESVNVSCWRRFVLAHGFLGRETLFVDGRSDRTDDLAQFADGAEIFLNYAGQFDVWEVVRSVQRRVYLDVDPGYTQVWARGYGCDMHLEEHDFHVTIGAAVHEEGCRIPDTGHDWIPTLPPLSLSFYRGWKGQPANSSGSWTTVTNWYGAAPVEMADLSLRGKRESFLALLALPNAVSRRFCVATDLAEDWEDFPDFTSAGWDFERVESVCGSMKRYLDFVLASAGELGVAKEGYVAAGTGWISDRSLAYLACGRPVVAQDTGWSRLIGEFAGLRAFRNVAEAARAIREVEKDHAAAVRSARHVAEQIFDARKVIAKVLGRLGVGVERFAEGTLAKAGAAGV